MANFENPIPDLDLTFNSQVLSEPNPDSSQIVFSSSKLDQVGLELGFIAISKRERVWLIRLN